MTSIRLEHGRRAAKRTRHPTRVGGVKSIVAESALVITEPLSRRDVDIARCNLCGREANCAMVSKCGSVFCSVECAEAVAGLYLG